MELTTQFWVTPKGGGQSYGVYVEDVILPLQVGQVLPICGEANDEQFIEVVGYQLRLCPASGLKGRVKQVVLAVNAKEVDGP